MIEKFPCLGKVAYRETVLKEHPDHEIADFMRSQGYLDKYPPTMRMNKSNEESAYLSALKFCAPVNPRVNDRSWHRAWAAVAVKTIRYCGNSRVMTFDEIKNTVDWSKTNGWPECVRWSSKREWLEYDGLEELDAYFSSENNSPYSLPGRDVVKIIAAYADSYPNMEHLKKLYDEDLPAGKFVPFNLVLLKKETRKHEKVDANQVRVITPVSTPHVMMSKMLHEDRMQKRARAGLRAGTALGHNPFGGGTQILFNYLCDPDQGFTQGYESDVKAQDSTIQTRDSIELLTINFHCLREEDRTYENWVRMRNLRDGIYTGPMIMPDGTVFLKGTDGRGGNTSGQHLTTEDNDLKVDFNYLYAYDRLKNPRSEPWNLLEDFERHIRLVHLSDDGVVVPDDDHQELFSFSQVACVLWHELGVIIEGPTPLYRPVVELQFLAMKFLYNEDWNMMFHSLDPQRVTSSIVQGGSDNPLTGRNTPHGMLLRLAGILVAAWGNPEIRRMVRNCIQYHLQKYKDLDSLDRRTPWEQAKKAVHDDYTLAKLYTGFEASASPVSSQLDKFPVEQSIEPQFAKTISKAVKNSIGKQVGEVFETATEHIVPHIERAAKSVGSTKAGKYLLGKFESAIDHISGVKPSHKRAKKRLKQLLEQVEQDKQRKKFHEHILAQMPPKSRKSNKGKRSKKSKKSSRKSKKSSKGGRKSTARAARGKGPSQKGKRSSNVSRGMSVLKNMSTKSSMKSNMYRGHVKGSEWLGAVKFDTKNGNVLAGANSAQGTLLLNLPISPNMGIAKIQKEVPYWERYRFVKCNIRVEGTEGTTTKGSFIIAQELDISDPPPTGIQGYRSMTARARKKNGRWFDRETVFKLDCKAAVAATADGGFAVNQYAGNDPRSCIQSVVYMMVEVAAASESGASLNGTTVAQIWMDYEVAFWSAVDDQQALTPITPIAYYVPLASLSSITSTNLFPNGQTDAQFGTDTLTLTYVAGQGTTITWPATWPGAAVVVQWSTSSGTLQYGHSSTTAAVLSDPNGSQYHIDCNSSGSANGGSTYLFTQITPGVAMSLVINFTVFTSPVFTAMQLWTYPLTLPSVGARKVLGEMHAMAGRMKQLERLLQVETAKLERKTEGKPIKPVKDEDSKYPEEEEESESSEEEDGPADAKQVDRIITRPGSALGLKPALKKRICDKCKQPGPHAWCAPEALEAVATGDPCRVCGWKRCVCASKAAQFDWRLELAEKRRKQEEGGKDQPAPSVPMAVSAGTNSQTANGDVQQEANLTLGNQGDDRQPRSLQDQKRLLGTAGGADDRTAARPQVPDERDRPLRAEESADLPRRQPIGPQAVGLPKGARSLDDGDYVVLKWLKQRLTGAGEKVNADVVEEAEVESSSASATARP